MPLLWTYNGQREIGRLYTTRDGEIEAVTATGRTLGLYPTKKAATAVIHAAWRDGRAA